MCMSGCDFHVPRFCTCNTKTDFLSHVNSYLLGYAMHHNLLRIVSQMVF